MQLDNEFLFGVTGVLSVVCGWLTLALGKKASKTELQSLEKMMLQLAEAAKDREQAQAELLRDYNRQQEQYFERQERLNEKFLEAAARSHEAR